jgi:hypothetical protein
MQRYGHKGDFEGPLLLLFTNGKSRTNLLSKLSSQGSLNGILASVGCKRTSTEAATSKSLLGVPPASTSTSIKDNCAAIFSAAGCSSVSEDWWIDPSGSTNGDNQLNESAEASLSSDINLLVRFFNPDITSMYPTAFT